MFTLDCRLLPCPQPIIQCKEALISCPEEIQVLVDNRPALENVTRFLEKNNYQVRVETKKEDFWAVNGRKPTLLTNRDTSAESHFHNVASSISAHEVLSSASAHEVLSSASFALNTPFAADTSDSLSIESPSCAILDSDSYIVSPSVLSHSVVSALLQKNNRTEKEGGTYEDYALALAHMESDKKTIVFLTSDCVGSGDDVLGTKLMESFLSCLKEMHIWQIVLLNGAVRLTTKKGKNLENLQELESNGVRVLVCGACLSHYGLYEEKKVGETTNMLDIVTALDLADKVIRP